MPPDARAPARGGGSRAPARAGASDAPGAATRVFALLGDPVAHSLSPLLHNAALRAQGLDGVYVVLRCEADAVHPLMRTLAFTGGGNVTVPWKAVAAECLDARTSAVTRTGACNTFWLEDGKLTGDNTDVVGFERALSEFRGDPRGARALLLGAGGGAAAVLAALLDGGAAQVTIVNRTHARAERLQSRMAAMDGRTRRAADVGELRGERFDLVVNATTLGLKEGDPHPLPLDAGVAFDAGFDLVYSPAGTPWTRALGVAGVPAIDGRSMLLHQAAAAFERWWPGSAPLEAMRAALP